MKPASPPVDSGGTGTDGPAHGDAELGDELGYEEAQHSVTSTEKLP